jgi:asparagine synthase (glutamine-hydrolysing)
MCGIAGIYGPAGSPVDLRLLEAMTQLQGHRGPDGEGYVLLDPAGNEKPLQVEAPVTGSLGSSRYALGLGHRRLAIIDLSPLGHQPMATADGRYWVTYNGEIYNYRELRTDLKSKGHRFRSSSDTEVLLAAYQEWGPDCLTRFNGMFAFALWDSARRLLWCARDRLGVKPFYYAWNGQRFAFASEIKALLAAGIPAKANQRALFDYLEGAYLDYSDATFFENIRQLPPAHWLVVEGETLTIKRYWDLPDVETNTKNSRDAMEEFTCLFQDAIRIRLHCEVPIGTCLSGGLDSSSIVCVANDLLKGRGQQKTFSSCFEDPAYDERRFIRPVLERTGAEAHFAFPDPKDLADSVLQLVWQQDEPFGSTSIFAQWSVMRLAAQRGVKVLLDGQGADELLAGYQGFYGAFFADLLGKGHWLTLLQELAAYRRLHRGFSQYAVANLARAVLPAPLVRLVRSRMTGSANWIDADFRRQWGPIPTGPPGPDTPFRNMQYGLLTGNGLRALLHYEDRNSMAFGIETRLPFLDYRLVEFLYQLDAAQKIRSGWTKAILRDAMVGVLPEEVRRRTDKMGFVTPEDLWLRTSLRDWAREILSESRTRARGYLNVDAALHEFEAHAAGRKNISFIIWRWINVELWCRVFLDNQPCVASSS